MYHLKPVFLALGAGLFCLSAAAHARRDIPSSFNLYAYGDGIGGFPVVYLDGEIPFHNSINMTGADVLISC